MTKSEDSGSPGWKASFFMPSAEDVARAVTAAAAAATAANSPRPSVVFSSKDESGDSQFQKMQRRVTRVLKGFSHPPEEQKTGTYNPEVLTSQKRQWASFQLQYLVCIFIQVYFIQECHCFIVLGMYFLSTVLHPLIPQFCVSRLFGKCLPKDLPLGPSILINFVYFCYLYNCDSNLYNSC